MDAVLIVDKPAGMTSHDVVARVRRIVGEKSVGHLGTLDPMATGVLPLVLGRFTRLAQFYNEADKRYEGTIRFGWATDTYDAEGQLAGPKQPVDVSLQQVQDAAGEFIGEISQFPPPFSAKKIAGISALLQLQANYFYTSFILAAQERLRALFYESRWPIRVHLRSFAAILILVVGRAPHGLAVFVSQDGERAVIG